jgi:hypothetical protein
LKRTDKILTTLFIALLMLLEVFVIAAQIRGYVEMTNTLSDLRADPEITNLNIDGPEPSLTGLFKTIFLYSIFILAPVLLGFYRFRKPDVGWMKILFYTISTIYLAGIIVLFLIVVTVNQLL